jgi:asparagine synthase (glutamine-hydrolysing)
MAAGLEVRVPFLDPDLIHFAARIPESQQIKNSNLKWILKKVAEPFLPSDVIYRKKVGFGVPLRGWIRNELRPLVSDILSKESLQARGFFKHDAVFQLIEENDKGRIDGSYLILSLICVEVWCRRFIDQKGALL